MGYGGCIEGVEEGDSAEGESGACTRNALCGICISTRALYSTRLEHRTHHAGLRRATVESSLTYVYHINYVRMRAGGSLRLEEGGCPRALAINERDARDVMVAAGGGVSACIA